MALMLKQRLAETGKSQGELAEAARMTRPAINALLNHGLWPASVNRRNTRPKIRHFLRKHGVTADDWEKEQGQPLEATAPAVEPAGTGSASLNKEKPLEMEMLLRKQTLTPKARQHFSLTSDPFVDPTSSEHVWLSPDIRYVREAMYQVARFGGFMAVVGESGAGKTTLREELIDRLRREDQAVTVIEPYVLGMEANDMKGKTLRATHIAEAILSEVAPAQSIKRSSESRFRQVHKALKDSAQTGMSHVLIIEEAHGLPVPTLKHLKRFRELKDGLRPLINVILLGQPELGMKLSEHNPEVREVVQRIEIVTLPAMVEIEPYLKHRFERVRMPLDKVIDRGGLEAICTRLTPRKTGGSLLYPLAIHNLLTASMNTAAELGVPQVSADVVRGV